MEKVGREGKPKVGSKIDFIYPIFLGIVMQFGSSGVGVCFR
jgi:hypothetical protein